MDLFVPIRSSTYKHAFRRSRINKNGYKRLQLGFLAGEIAVPEDFDHMGEADIADLFGTGS